MGKWLSGSDPVSGEPHGIEPADISRALGRFSLRDARRIVEGEHGGFFGYKLVYSGGDDALALLPVTDALRCARELREAFGAAMRGAGAANATVSVGVAIAHQSHPLQQVIREAQRALHLAKDRYGRDAYCLSVLKRSGEHITTGAPWRLGGDGPETTAALAHVTEAMRADKLSPRFAYRLRREFDPLLEAPGDGAAIRAMFRAEVTRVFKRQSRPRWEVDPDGRYPERKVLLDELLALVDAELAPAEFVRLMAAAAFMARGGAE